jgi:hypothetical protein
MIGVSTSFKVTTQLPDDRLMVSEQICQHLRGRGILPWMFLQAFWHNLCHSFSGFFASLHVH